MQRTSSFDVAVVGTGLAGLAAALGCAQQGLSVALIGPRPTPSSPSAFDARIYAIAPASVDLLARLGVWSQVDPARTCAIERMRVFGDSGDELTFDAYGATVERLATIVEERECSACSKPRATTSRRRANGGVRFFSEANDGLSIELPTVQRWSARLLIGADGANSAVRAAAGISATVKPYGQTAVVANFACERPHLNTAWQWFTEEGVVALLPLPGNHVSLVWSAPASLAEKLAAVPVEELAQRVTSRSGSALGTMNAVGAAHSFPLRLITVQRLISNRLALVGDAAHVVHPLAGQGLNLGLQDVAQLFDVIRAREAFRDLGDSVLLRRYERPRAEAIGLMRFTTDGLARLFVIDDPRAPAAQYGNGRRKPIGASENANSPGAG
jgi:ubiquinone biosynthesis UbiH/UbiF/VisC/COQ6 family hydroxylase